MHSPTSIHNTDVAILNRLIGAAIEDLSPEVVHYILGLNFHQKDRERMHVLAAKAQQGTLTPTEQDEIESYERVGHWLALLKSKARKSLKATSVDT
jgi:hypothetical protein